MTPTVTPSRIPTVTPTKTQRQRQRCCRRLRQPVKLHNKHANNGPDGHTDQIPTVTPTAYDRDTVSDCGGRSYRGTMDHRVVSPDQPGTPKGGVPLLREPSSALLAAAAIRAEEIIHFFPTRVRTAATALPYWKGLTTGPREEHLARDRRRLRQSM
jgi:hypothetical protein